MYIYSKAIETLMQVYPKAHFVLCVDKRPVRGQPWLMPPSTREILNHKGPVGLVPYSIGLAALDVDHGNPSRLLREYPPATTQLTPRGIHAFYQHDVPLPNGKWSLMGCSGDIRSANGYVVLYQPERLVEVQHGGPLPLTGLKPPHVRREWGTQPLDAETDPEHDDLLRAVWGIYWRIPRAARGQRHETLKRVLARATGAPRNWNRSRREVRTLAHWVAAHFETRDGFTFAEIERMADWIHRRRQASLQSGRQAKGFSEIQRRRNVASQAVRSERSAAQAKRIREMRRQGMAVKRIAERLSVSVRTVSRALHSNSTDTRY